MVYSSNINEVARVILNFLLFFFFLRKDFARTKSTKSSKSAKSTKRHKDTQAKAQNANKRISNYFCGYDIFEYRNLKLP